MLLVAPVTSAVFYGAQPHWGCPIGALSSELAGRDPAAGAEVAATSNAGARC
jgi:hypothetical protein